MVAKSTRESRLRLLIAALCTCAVFLFSSEPAYSAHPRQLRRDVDKIILPLVDPELPLAKRYLGSIVGLTRIIQDSWIY